MGESWGLGKFDPDLNYGIDRKVCQGSIELRLKTCIVLDEVLAERRPTQCMFEPQLHSERPCCFDFDRHTRGCFLVLPCSNTKYAPFQGPKQVPTVGQPQPVAELHSCMVGAPYR